MDDVPKSAADFDEATWREQLLALNPWTCGLAISRVVEEFAVARQKATLARLAEGQEAWNAWANGMLALKSTLEAAGLWATGRWTPQACPVGRNEAAQTWLTLACTVFSTKAQPHRFDRGAFRDYTFP